MNLLYAIEITLLLMALLNFGVTSSASTFFSGPIDFRNPDIKGVADEPISSPKVWQQVIIETDLINNLPEDDQSFLAIIEVRNPEDVTTFLAWQAGIIQARDIATIGVSWLPTEPSRYEIRVFAISDFEQKQILSGVQSSEIEVK